MRTIIEHNITWYSS